MANPEVIERKFTNSSGYYPDTETVVKWVPGSKTINVIVKCLPGLQWWECPNAETLRRQVDEAIKGQGIKRDGARMYRNDGPMAQWWYVYSVKAA